MLIDGLRERQPCGPTAEMHGQVRGPASSLPTRPAPPADLKEERDQVQLAQALHVRNVVRQVVHHSSDDAQTGALDRHRARVGGGLPVAAARFAMERGKHPARCVCALGEHGYGP